VPTPWRQCWRVYAAIWRRDALPRASWTARSARSSRRGAPDPGNYRPLTLLNTDYRALARLLSDRMLPALQAIIPRTQSAFLRGRDIGDSIMALELLPDALRQDRTAALALFLDFGRPMTRWDRGFLRDAMLELGLPSSFVALTQTLLRGTWARARVNGFLSRPAQFHAGLRQGCALAG